MTRPKALKKCLTFDIIYRTSVPELVNTDPLRLKQILLNLVSNAIKFTSEGGVRIEVSCLSEEERLSIEIADSGIGLSEHELAGLFIPFSQANSSTTRNYGGTGLGLVISKNLAQELGGDIHVQSTPGLGSSFTLTLATGSLQGVDMFHDPPQQEGKTQESLERTARANNPVMRQLSGNVLVADDCQDNRDLISFYLRKLGLEVVLVNNGQLAVEVGLAQEFDLILMDRQMPILDGFDATKKLRTHGVRTPIVALTANAMRRDVEKALEVGCSGHIGKPFERDFFLEEVEKYLHGKSESDTHTSTDLSVDPEHRRLVNAFINGLPEKLTKIERAYNTGQWNDIVTIAQQLSNARTYGYTMLSYLVHLLKGAAVSHSVGAVYELIEEIKKLCARIVNGREEVAGSRKDLLSYVQSQLCDPIHGILGTTELLLETDLSSEQRESLARITTSMQSLYSRSNYLLDFYKVGSQELRLHPHRIDFHRFLSDFCCMLSV